MSIFTRQGITSGNEAIFLKGNLAEGLNGSLLSLSNRYYSVPKVYIKYLTQLTGLLVYSGVGTLHDCHLLDNSKGKIAAKINAHIPLIHA
jgi:hypothetical protein